MRSLTPGIPGRRQQMPAHDQVDPHAGLRRAVELLDHAGIGDAVDLDDDARRPALRAACARSRSISSVSRRRRLTGATSSSW